MNDENGKRKTLKLLSLNTWFGLGAYHIIGLEAYQSAKAQEKRYQCLVAGLRRHAPDVVFLQEANPLPKYARRLSGDVEMNQIHATTNCGIRIGRVALPANLRMGIAMLAKPDLGLEEKGTYRTGGTGLAGEFACFQASEITAVHAGSITVNSRPLYLFNFHAYFSPPDTEAFRERLRKMLLEQKVPKDDWYKYFKELSKKYLRTQQDILQAISVVRRVTNGRIPFIFAGDLNAYLPDYPALERFERELNLIDAYKAAHPSEPGYTWDPYKNDNTRYDSSRYWPDGRLKRLLGRLSADYTAEKQSRIDYIFLSPQFSADQIVDSRIVFDSPLDGVFASDHFGVMTEVELGKTLKFDKD